MKKAILSLLLAVVATGSLWAWGGQGHSTVAYIAEKHLTPRAKANIESYLNGRSIVYYAAWMDFNRTDPPMDVTRDWHVDYWTDDMRTDANGNPAPPCSVSQIKRIVSEMGNFRTLSDSLVTINIKYLTHLVGDMHCPVHIDFPTSRPMKVKEGKTTIKVHKMWDGRVLDSKHNGLSPQQMAVELDRYSATEIAAFQAGTPDDWHNECLEYSKRAIDMIPANKQVDYETYFNKVIDIAENRITLAGYRLAAILNSIFDK